MRRAGLSILAVLIAVAPVAASAQQAPLVVDPARQAVAERIAARLLPAGAFTTMMRTTLDKVATGMMDQMTAMPIAEIARISGVNAEKASALSAVTLRQVLEVVDPAYDQRMRITMKVMTGEMVVIMNGLEPEYRAGLADALAARFTPDQLSELDRFFATPTGSAYAAQSMTLYVDPAMMRRMDTIMPRVMNAMPAMMQKVIAATDHLPKQGDLKNLTSDQKARLAALFGEEDKK